MAQEHGLRFRISAVTNEERHQAIDRGKSAVLKAGGSILDFKMFSNVSINLVVELSESGQLRVVEELRNAGWKIEQQPEPAENRQSGSENRTGTFHIAFSEGDGELAIPVPSVPG